MKTYAFATRTAKEIMRDPLNIAFGLGFPIVLIVLLSIIQSNIPAELFTIESLAPGICIFGLSFMTLFSATLVSKDRESAFFYRLCTTPLTVYDFIFGYTLPILPIAVLQTSVTYAFSFIFGLPFSVNILLSVVFTFPISVIFIAVGLICGTVFTSKQVGGFCGALFTNLTAWLSGIWFDIELTGGIFKTIGKILPFFHAVELQRAIISGNLEKMFPHIWWILGYAFGLAVIAVFIFLRKMKSK